MIFPGKSSVDIMLIDIIAQMSLIRMHLTTLLETKLHLFMSLFFYANKITVKHFRVFIIMYKVNAFMENLIKQILGFKEKIKP